MTNENPNKKTKLSMENPKEAVEQYRAKGHNVIPFDSHNKVVKIESWKQFIPPNNIPDEQYEEWYRNGTFSHGMAIMLGRLNNNKKDQDTPLFGIGIDCDNQAGIDLVLEAFGFKTITEASKYVIVNQHRDQKYKAHFILYSHKEIPQIRTYVRPTEGDDIDLKEKPKVELLGAGHVLIVEPSIHRDGYPYETPEGGTMDPITMDDLQQRFEEAFKKCEIPYGNNGVTHTYNNGIEVGLNEEGKIPTKLLFDPYTKIYEGDRNNQLLRVASILLFRNQSILEEYKIREIWEEWNKNHCIPPIEDKKELNSIWKSAIGYVKESNKQRDYERHLYQERLKREQAQDEFFASERRKKEQSKPLTIAEVARLEEEDKFHYAVGQITSIGSLHKRVRSYTNKCMKCGKTKTNTYPYPVTGESFAKHKGRYAGRCSDVFWEGDCEGEVKKTPEWVSAINIEVSDSNTLQDIDKLRCILFGDYTKDVGIGENGTLLGAIQMEAPIKNSQTFAFNYCLSIKYENREQEELSNLDVQAIKRFRKRYTNDDELMNKFIGMTACHIIGHDNIKEGILYMVTNAKPDKPEMRQRLHGIIISPPALAKTALLRYATTLMTRSTFETCQTSTGLSLFAMVEKEGDMKLIRLGPIARSLFAATDEFNRTGNSDQEKYLGAMQEGFFTSNKFGKGKRIVCPVTILASINPPIGSKAVTSDTKLDLSEMNVIPPVMDRFDFKWYIMPMEDEQFDNLIDKKMEFVDHPAPDYSHLISMWIKYAKERYNPRLSDIARENLKLAVKDLRRNNKNLSPRVIETLANATKARARFLLKDTADENDAAAIIKFYSMMIQAYSDHTIKARNIIDIGVEECYKLLAEEIIVNQTVAYTFKDLLQKACNHKQLSKYVMSGVAKEKYFDISENKRARNIYERLLTKYPDIIIVSKHPTTLQLPIDKVQSHSDHSDFWSDCPVRMDLSISCSKSPVF
jgi:MoxR-like ATPase